MADALLICVPTFPDGGTIYPSVNNLGKNAHRGGRKTAEYHALYKAVKDEAEAQMAATGWVTADYYVEVHWKRYVTTRRTFDASNTFKCEGDSLQAAGVVANDHLIRPFPDVPQYDPSPGAIDRIVMVVMRLYPPAILAEAKPRIVQPAKAKPRKAKEYVPSPAFIEAQAEARRRQSLRPRTLDELKSGDVLRPDEVGPFMKALRNGDVSARAAPRKVSR